MEKNYETYLNAYRVTHSPNSLRIVSQVIRKLPPIEQLTRDSILVILGSYENIATRRLYYKNIKLLLRYLGKPELLDGIHIKTPKTSITRADLLTQSEVSAILRACKDPLLRGLVEFLLESGARISEALNLTINDLIIEKDFVITTLRSNKTDSSRQVPLLRDNLTGFLYYLSTCDDHKVFPIKYDAVWIKFKTRLKRSGIKPHRKLFHIFRHMKATHLLDLALRGDIKCFILIAGDSDFVPAIQAIKNAGATVRVVYCRKTTSSMSVTVHRDLLMHADERLELTDDFCSDLRR